MNKSLFFCLCCITITACKSTGSVGQTPMFGYYPDNWGKKASAAIDQEKRNIPKDCPSLTSRIEQFKKTIVLTNAQREKEMLDSLVNTLPAGTASEMAIVDDYSQGFNFFHCTTLMIYNAQGDLAAYLKGCKSDPDPILMESTPFILEKTKDKNKDMLSKYLKMQSNCNLDGIFIITVMTPDFKIKNIKVVLMPN